jgi:hypothetical protein
MIYIIEPNGQAAVLASATGIDGDDPALAASLSLDGGSLWPIAEVVKNHQQRVILDLESTFQSTFPSGAWHQGANSAVLLPIMPSGETGRSGVLIAGLNPYRLFDDYYAGFTKLIAGQLSGCHKVKALTGPADQWRHELQ